MGAPVLPTSTHATLAGHEAPVLAARFSKDGAYLLTAGKDRTFRLWNPRKGTCIKTYAGHAREVRDVDAAAEAWYPLQAQQQQLALGGTLLAIHLVTPLLWRLRRDAAPLASPELAASLHMERLAVRFVPACSAWSAKPCRGGLSATTGGSGNGSMATVERGLTPQLIVYTRGMLKWLHAHGPRPRVGAATRRRSRPDSSEATGSGSSARPLPR